MISWEHMDKLGAHALHREHRNELRAQAKSTLIKLKQDLGETVRQLLGKSLSVLDFYPE